MSHVDEKIESDDQRAGKKEEKRTMKETYFGKFYADYPDLEYL